jgi:DNA-binding IclR family transcriptional regulator
VDKSSGVGVLDKSVAILAALEHGPASLGTLAERTTLPRPTAHRLAVALEVHGFVARDIAGRFVLGPRLAELAAATSTDRLLAAAPPILSRLRDATGESAQLYRRQGEMRVCLAAAERASGLRDTVPVGAALPMTAGSAAQVLLAWEDAERLRPVLSKARFTPAALANVRRRGWAATIAEREPGLASVSAPVFGGGGPGLGGPAGRVVAAVSVSGPVERFTRSPGRLHAERVVAAGRELTAALRAPT